MKPRPPLLLAITTGHGESPEALEEWAMALARADIDALRIREPTLGDAAQLDRARRLRERCRGAPVVVVSGRPDIALAADAEGVHLPAAGLPVAAVRRWIGDDRLLGVSTHRVGEVDAARRAGADYALFGPIYPTPSKPDWVGGDRLAELERAAAFGLPVLAIGGVTIARLGELAGAGAAGVAGIRVFGRREELPELSAEARLRFGTRERR